jgi:hypothetical protein
MMEAALERSLAEAGLDRNFLTVITMVEVDADDPLFQNPTKPIGPFYTDEDAAQKTYTMVRTDKGMRRVIASPQPIGIVPHREIKQLVLVETDRKKAAALRQGVATGRILADAANRARDMANEPANLFTPTVMAEQARAIAAEASLECEILEREQMQELGIEYFHVTYAEGGPAPHSVPFQDGILLQFGRELKKILKIPVMTSSIHDPKLAEKAVTEGQTDIVSTARCMIADPEFVNKIKKNKLGDIVKCTDCGSCTGLCVTARDTAMHASSG